MKPATRKRNAEVKSYVWTRCWRGGSGHHADRWWTDIRIFATDHRSEIDDPLYCKALVLHDGETEIALVTNDLMGVHLDLVRRVREQVTADTGIPGDNVMVCASHTHFGPEIGAMFGGRPVETEADRAYVLTLERLMATAVKMAHDRLEPARIGAGRGEVDHISFNRRLDRQDGKVETVFAVPPTPGVKPVDHSLRFAPIDPEVRVLRVESTAGEVIASVINFACHPVCGSVDQLHSISADYCGYAMNLVEAEEGGVCLFTPGCGGNIVPIQRGWLSKRKVGVSLGTEVLNVLQWIQVEDQVTLRAIRKDLEMPLRPQRSVEQARRLFEEKKANLQDAQGMSDTERKGGAVEGPRSSTPGRVSGGAHRSNDGNPGAGNK